jgi:hypothetical protein
VAAALGPLRDDEVDSRLLVLQRVVDAAAERSDEPARLLDLVDHVGRRRAQGVRHDPHLLVLEHGLDLRARGGGRPAEQLAGVLTLGQLGNAVIGQQLGGELAVAVRDGRAQLRLELVDVELALARVLPGNHDVDAVGLVAHVLVDPLELDLELVRGEADGPQDSEATGVADGSHDVAAVGEGEDRELDPESFA